MNCEEFLKALSEYLDGEVDPSICEGFEEHLADCNPCQIVVDTTRMTIRLFRAGQPYELPPEFDERLKEVLRRAWEQKFSHRS